MVLAWPFLQFAGHKHVEPVPAVRVLVRFAAVAVLTECVHPPCAAAAYSLSKTQMAQHDALAAVPT